MERSSWKGLLGPISVACVWFGTHVGPGFASGAQLVQYFVGYGWLGVYIGPLVLMVISSWIVYHVLEVCRLYQVYNYQEFYNVVFGKARKVFVVYKEVCVLLSSVVIASMCYASGGSLLETVGVPYFIGGIATFMIVAILLGQFGILTIVNWGYKIVFSYMGVPVIFIPFIFILPYWIRRKKRESQLMQ